MHSNADICTNEEFVLEEIETSVWNEVNVLIIVKKTRGYMLESGTFMARVYAITLFKKQGVYGAS